MLSQAGVLRRVIGRQTGVVGPSERRPKALVCEVNVRKERRRVSRDALVVARHRGLRMFDRRLDGAACPIDLCLQIVSAWPRDVHAGSLQAGSALAQIAVSIVESITLERYLSERQQGKAPIARENGGGRERLA